MLTTKHKAAPWFFILSLLFIICILTPAFAITTSELSTGYFTNPTKVALAPPRVKWTVNLNAQVYAYHPLNLHTFLVATNKGLASIPYDTGVIAWVMQPRAATSLITAGALVDDIWLYQTANGNAIQRQVVLENRLLKRNHIATRLNWEISSPGQLISNTNRSDAETQIHLYQNFSNLLIAVDKSGQLRWTYPANTKVKHTHRLPNYILFGEQNRWVILDSVSGQRITHSTLSGTPVATPYESNQSVYIMEQDRTNVFLSRWSLEGQLWWRKNIDGHSIVNVGYITATENELVLAYNTSINQSKVMGFHKKTGDILWTHQFLEPISTQPLPLASMVYLGYYGYVRGIESSTGSLLWETDFPGIVHSLNHQSNLEALVVISDQGIVHSIGPISP